MSVRGVLVDQTFAVHDLPSDACIPVQRDDNDPIFAGDIRAAVALVDQDPDYYGWVIGWHGGVDDAGDAVIVLAGDVWVSPNSEDAGARAVDELLA